MRLALVISAIMFAAILQSSLAGQAGNKRQQAGPHNIEAANGEQNSPHQSPPSTEQSNPASSTTRPNNSGTQEDDRATRDKITFFTGVLALLAVLQFGAMVAQFIAMHKQAHYMRRGLFVAVRSARAAKKSAAAALLNAQAVINAERARLAVDLELAPLFGNVLFGQGEMVAHFTVKCTNIGKTSAWVYRILADFRSVEIIPQKPTPPDAFDIHATPRNLRVDEAFSESFSLRCIEGYDIHKQLLIHGAVEFRDVYEKIGYCNFGYTVSPDGKALYRIDYPFAYNCNTYED
jgi:hypothetical protein